MSVISYSDDFDFDNTQAEQVSVALPTGYYLVWIEKSQMRENKNGSGSHLNLPLRVLNGDYVGAMIYDNLNLDHHNKITVQIAGKRFKAICDAIGLKKRPRQTKSLDKKPLVVKIVYDEELGQSDIKGYTALNTPVYKGSKVNEYAGDAEGDEEEDFDENEDEEDHDDSPKKKPAKSVRLVKAKQETPVWGDDDSDEDVEM